MNYLKITLTSLTLVLLNFIGEIHGINNSTYAQQTKREVAGKLIEVEGSVRIKRPSQSQYTLVEKGTTLYYDDLLLTSSSARAVVLCSNNKRWIVPAGVVSGVANGCPRGNSNSVSPR